MQDGGLDGHPRFSLPYRDYELPADGRGGSASRSLRACTQSPNSVLALQAIGGEPSDCKAFWQLS